MLSVWPAPYAPVAFAMDGSFRHSVPPGTASRPMTEHKEDSEIFVASSPSSVVVETTTESRASFSEGFRDAVLCRQYACTDSCARFSMALSSPVESSTSSSSSKYSSTSSSSSVFEQTACLDRCSFKSASALTKLDKSAEYNEI
ncbi:hypothetical protein T265_05438 [Opisthorchis viverrini]|uniref:Uncharacterized protein n=1 Tax=Opisthorchis viverrini TaxID=6198 RepID=A0A074ZKI4_OPIVI|nr:hypothetical protein T265_05438 [Opisthorchis viverrini]KER27551.1 hypothetical protein T265_05438 [Opisthorchis viverrini]